MQRLKRREKLRRAGCPGEALGMGAGIGPLQREGTGHGDSEVVVKRPCPGIIKHIARASDRIGRHWRSGSQGFGNDIAECVRLGKTRTSALR